MRKFLPVTTTALMSALSVVLSRFASIRVPIGGVEGIRIGFGALPNILVGIVYGPLYGGLSGATADMIGFMLSPMGGGFMPHFTLTAALSGAIPGVVFRLFSIKSRQAASYLSLGFSIAVSSVLVSCGLTPYFLHILFGLDYRTVLIPRIFAVLLEIPIYTFVSHAIYRCFCENTLNR
jgi:ECF transporter S component (folate family)